MAYLTKTYRPFTSPTGSRGGWATSTAAAAVTLNLKSAQCQRIDPGGDHRNVTLPTVTEDHDGYWMQILNAADAAENLVIKDAAASTIGTVNQSEMGIFYVDSAGAWQLYAIVTATYV